MSFLLCPTVLGPGICQISRNRTSQKNDRRDSYHTAREITQDCLSATGAAWHTRLRLQACSSLVVQFSWRSRNSTRMFLDIRPEFSISLYHRVKLEEKRNCRTMGQRHIRLDFSNIEADRLKLQLHSSFGRIYQGI